MVFFFELVICSCWFVFGVCLIVLAFAWIFRYGFGVCLVRHLVVVVCLVVLVFAW